MKKQESKWNVDSTQSLGKKNENEYNSFRNSMNNHSESELEQEDEELDLVFSSRVIPLSLQDQQRVQLATSLVIDVFSDASVAQSFSANPSAYMAERHLTYEGSLDYGIIQMALAFSNSDIRQAIIDHDIESFVSLCQTEGLLTIPTGVESAGLEGVEQLLESIGFSDEELGQMQTSGVMVWAFLVLLIIGIINIAVVANLGAAINLVAVANSVTFINSDSSGYGTDYYIEDLTPCPVALWAILNEDISSTQIILNSVAESYFGEIDSYLENHYSEYTENEEFRNRVQVLIKANLIKYITQQ